MRGFRFKPNQKKIDFKTLEPSQIEFLCNMGIINKMISDRKGLSSDQQLQDDFDSTVKVYFLVKKNFEYNVFYGKEFDDFLEKNSLKVSLKMTDKSKKCIDHFIKSL